MHVDVATSLCKVRKMCGVFSIFFNYHPLPEYITYLVSTTTHSPNT